MQHCVIILIDGLVFVYTVYAVSYSITLMILKLDNGVYN